jgi:5-hydroxyisourate hydrolase-like protein (transthyretin family)
LSVVLACAACGLSAPAVGADTSTGAGAIVGVVTDASTDHPVANVEVEVSAPAEGERTTCTATDGSYSVAGLASDTYTVAFSTDSGLCPTSSPSPSYVSQQVTQAVSSPATSTVNASLQPAGLLSGTVTDSLTGAPLRNVPVLAVPTGSGAISTEGYQCTGASGGYTMSGLAPGSYTVEFATGGCSSGDGGFVPQYYPGTSAASQATPVTVDAGATTTGIDAALARDSTSADGMITGTVTDSANGQPAANIPVEADPNPNVGNYAVTCTSSTGAYLLDDLPPGSSYRVVFAPDDEGLCTGAPFMPEIYNDIPPAITEVGPQTTVADATPVTVSAGTATESIDGAVAPAATISGTLTDAGTGQPAANTVVLVYNAAGTEVGSGCTQADGTYTTSILPSGTYRVGFASDPTEYGFCLVFSNTYLPAYYGHATSLATATRISVNAPTDVTGINGSVVKGSVITGTITTPDAPNIGVSAEVQVYNSAGAVVGASSEATDGTYRVGGLAPGKYLVQFSALGYETQYYSGTPLASAATPVSVGTGTTSSGIDATLVPTTHTASISGTVTDAITREPITGIDVAVETPGGGPIEGTATTGADGGYTIAGVPAGSYEVAFINLSDRYLTEFFEDSATAAQATLVQPNSGARLSGVNAAMARQTTRSTAALVSPSVIAASARSVSVELACPAASSCSGRVSLSALKATPGSRRADRAAATATATANRTKPFAVRTGHVDRVRFALTRRERTALARRHRATAVLTVRQRSRTRRYTIAITTKPVR